MIAYVSGTLISIRDDSVIIDNQGLGYRVFCPNPYRLKIGETVTLYTYHHVREDAILLFGFIEQEELDLFNKLITVKGLGPKTGLNIMGKVPYTEIINAIETSNATFLKTLPGVGPKMASQIVLDLKGKLVHTEVVSKELPILDDVFDTLSELGFKRAEFSRIKNDLLKHENQNFDELIRYALKLLAK